MRASAGTVAPWLALAAFRLRLDRIRIPAWIVAGMLVTILVASTWDALYPTAAERLSFAATLQAAPALTALLGPLQAPESTGGLTTWRIGGISVLMLGIVAVFLVVRHTRADLATGRGELILSGRLRRRSLISSGLVPALVLAMGIGLVFAGALGFGGRGWTGALVYGMSVSGCLALFATIASVVAQSVSSSRGANGVGILVIALMFVVTAIAHTRDESSLAYLTPFGWMAKASPYALNQWSWAALPWLLAFVVLVASLLLAESRDLGAAWTRERVGRAHARRWMAHPWALIWRVDRSLILGWFAGLFGLSLFMGYLTGSLTQLLADNPQVKELMSRLTEGTPSANFTPLILTFTALGAAAYPISILLRQANDEVEGRVELMLSTRMRRGQLLGARVLEALLGSVILQVIVGIGVGFVSGFFADDRVSSLTDALGFAIVTIPAIWFIAGLAALVVTRAPQLAWLSWCALAWCVVFGELAPLMNLPEWTLRLTPYWYSPSWPITADAWPALLMTLFSAVMCTVARAVFHRRQIPG